MESLDSATHLNSAMRMGSGSMNPATHLDMDSAMRMDPAELEQMIIEETY